MEFEKLSNNKGKYMKIPEELAREYAYPQEPTPQEKAETTRPVVRRKPKKIRVSHAEYEAIRNTGRKTICVSHSEHEAILSNIRSGDHDEAARLIREAVDGI